MDKAGLNQPQKKEFKLTQDQIADYREAFQLFDKDSDGIIKTDQLGLLIRSLNHNPTNEEIKQYIQEVDPEETGQDIDHEQVLLDAFSVFDKNKDGMCVTQELQAVLKQLGEKLTESECEEFIKLADPNDNKQFRYDELARLLTTKYLN
ncbi:hypothetical protein PPERSA_09345 [Pseudocohnilembus persalinus]|uniref:Calmodulin n=1 Tax=Pseudocohnilembus persalinus TaxID=266149 RepID=A0A0V0QY06_PSEPJ|nr:hypothetical protein PPERSA_09345 [Pseudocohnilembus persalinus]|eukprot:KRX07131.1 hypothetical protein PPERSA_09345 [Pseudocohnilembus persalinus]